MEYSEAPKVARLGLCGRCLLCMSVSYLSAIRISLSQEPVVADDYVQGAVRLDLRVLAEERVGEVRAHLKGFLTTYSAIFAPERSWS